MYHKTSFFPNELGRLDKKTGRNFSREFFYKEFCPIKEFLQEILSDGRSAERRTPVRADRLRRFFLRP